MVLLKDYLHMKVNETALQSSQGLPASAYNNIDMPVVTVRTSTTYGRHLSRLVVKTGSAKTKTKTISGKTKTKTKTEVFETKTKTANGSMKQNAHSSRKNYFYQKLQRH